MTGPLRGPAVPVFAGDDVTLLDWQTGKVLWRHAGDPGSDGASAFAMAQPNGTAMAIGLGSLNRAGQIDQLWIISADGRVMQVVRGVFYAAFSAGF